MRGTWLLLTLVASPLASPSSAWIPPKASLAEARFSEQVQADAPVVGGDIIGIVVGPSDWHALGRRLFLRSPGQQVSSACIEAASVDGSYVAFNNYTFKPQAAGTYVEIPLRAAFPQGTTHPKRFAAASADTMALLAREGLCSALTTRLLPLRWANDQIKEGASLELTIAVQSGRSSVYFQVGSSPYPDTPCTPIQGERTTAFDTLCQVTIDAKKPQSLALRLRRCAFDDCVDAPVEALDL